MGVIRMTHDTRAQNIFLSYSDQINIKNLIVTILNRLILGELNYLIAEV